MISLMFSPRVLITAGPTHEPIDAVRYIGNRSSGRMGLALAQACAQRKWFTTLLLGPISIEVDPAKFPQIQIIRFHTAAELADRLRQQWPQHDVLFMAAAVADFRPASPVQPNQKLKRTDRSLTLQLEPTPDLLASLSAMTQPHQTVIGFALEPLDDSDPGAFLDAARCKLASKSLHAIVANPLQTMNAAHIEATVLFDDGRSLSPGLLAKDDFADWLIDAVQPMCHARLMTRSPSHAATASQTLKTE